MLPLARNGEEPVVTCTLSGLLRRGGGVGIGGLGEDVVEDDDVSRRDLDLVGRASVVPFKSGDDAEFPPT